MSSQAPRARRTALALGAVAGTSLVTLLGLGAGPALAADTTARVDAGVLEISGTRAADQIALVLKGGDPNTLLVDVGNDGTGDFAFDRSTFTAIHVRGRRGADELRVSDNGGTFTDEAVRLDGGRGADTLIGASGDDTLIGGRGDDVADGNRGADHALLGAGDDRFTWDPGDGSDTVDGETGDDALGFNGSNAGEKIGISANGSDARLTRDVGAITMDLAGIEDTDVLTLGGADKVTVDDLSGTDLETTHVALAATGGGADGQTDTVVADGTDGADQAYVSSQDGEAVVTGLGSEVRVSGGPADSDSVAVDGLGGTDTVNYDGTNADDQVGVALNGTAVRTFTAASLPLDVTGTEDLAVHGLGGNDTITGSNGIANLTRLTVDGGSGDDVLGGGDGADVLQGGSGDDAVDGNRGNDVADLGRGDDRFTWDPGDGSDTVEGNRGGDTLDFNGSNIGEKIDLSANGSRARLFRDVGAVTMDTNEVEHVGVRAIGGADTVTVGDLSGTDVQSADVDLSATGGTGDGAADTVIANGTPRADKVRVSRSGGTVLVGGFPAEITIAGSEAANDRLQVNTVAGNDRVTVAPDVSGVITPSVDLGPGN